MTTPAMEATPAHGRAHHEDWPSGWMLGATLMVTLAEVLRTQPDDLEPVQCPSGLTVAGWRPLLARAN